MAIGNAERGAEALWQTSRDYASLILIFVAGTLVAGLEMRSWTPACRLIMVS